MPIVSTAQETHSWVIRNKATGEIVMETFNPRLVAALNTEKYEAVPIGQHLGSLNRSPYNHWPYTGSKGFWGSNRSKGK